VTYTGQYEDEKQKILQLEADELLHISGARRAWYEFRRNRFALVGAVFMIFIAFMAIFAPIVSTHDPHKQSLRKRMKPPTAEHWLGTDEVGRDVYSRLVYGARVSLFVGVVGTAAATDSESMLISGSTRPAERTSGRLILTGKRRPRVRAPATVQTSWNT